MRRVFAFALILAPCLTMAQTSTTTTLTSTPATLAQGQVEMTVVKVTATSGVPAGTVQLLGDGAVVATATLSNGSATFNTNTSSVAPGTYTVVAKYEGGSGFAASTSGNVSVTVTAPSPTTTALTVSPTDIQLGSTAYLIARVGRNSGGNPPTGTVAFYAGGELGKATLVNGIAKLSASAAGIPQAKYSVTAKYLGANGDASSVSPAVAVSVTPAVDVLTSRYNSRRTGVQTQETILTPANVNTTSFGKIATYTVDGYLYAQPLYISSYKMSDGALHNVVIASTAAGTVYAFDADGNNPVAGYLWKQSILANGEAVQDTSDYGCGNPSPNTGILGTPVADRNTGAIYVIGAVKTTSGTTTYAQKLHALRISDGAEILNGPTVIQASVPGTGAGTSGGMVSFNPLRSAERAAMLEASGQVWITWASHCDAGPYHGWTMAYNAADISKQTAVNNNTPNGSDGGIWMTAAGSSTDDQDNIFTASGNGTFDVNTGGSDYGDSVSRLAYAPAFGATAASLSVGDWFVPDDQSYLSDHDQDMGMVAPLIIQDPTGSEPNLLVNADKTGQIYLLDRDNLGTYDMGTKGPDGLNDAVQQWSTGSIFSSFAWFNNTLYIGATGTNLAAYTFTPGTSTTPGQFNTTPASKSAHSFGGGSAGGFQPVISASGTANAILWGLDNTTGAGATLYAYNPANLATLYYSSTTASGNRDLGPPPVKFTLPVVANGKVFVGGQGQLVVYGLLGQ